MQRSRYDELYEEYYGILKSKKGTKYERLAAIVFKSLTESGVVVIHDLRLRGESDVLHQIDVVVELNGVKKRVLIECKDFDISGNKVGLGILRCFWGAVDDIKPDEAIVITCNGFTRDSRKYAKAKGIKLAVLREFQDEDWEGRIKTIVVNLTALIPSIPVVSYLVADEERAKEFSNAVKSTGVSAGRLVRGMPVYLNTPEGRFQINDFVDREIHKNSSLEPGPKELPVVLKNSTVEIGNKGVIPIDGIKINYELLGKTKSFEITGGLPVLILIIMKGFGGSDMLIGDDAVVSEEQLKKYVIDPDTAKVTPL